MFYNVSLTVPGKRLFSDILSYIEKLVLKSLGQFSNTVFHCMRLAIAEDHRPTSLPQIVSRQRSNKLLELKKRQHREKTWSTHDPWHLGAGFVQDLVLILVPVPELWSQIHVLQPPQLVQFPFTKVPESIFIVFHSIKANFHFRKGKRVAFIVIRMGRKWTHLQHWSSQLPWSITSPSQSLRNFTDTNIISLEIYEFL